MSDAICEREGGKGRVENVPVGLSLIESELGEGLLGNESILELGEHELSVTGEERAGSWRKEKNESVQKMISFRVPVSFFPSPF